MPGLLAVGALLLALVAALVLVGGSAKKADIDPSAPPRLLARQATVDLGRVPFERLAEARFELVNTGGGIVRLVGAPTVRMLEGC